MDRVVACGATDEGSTPSGDTGHKLKFVIKSKKSLTNSQTLRIATLRKEV